MTGAAGFIGSTLVRALLEEGESVVGIDNFSPYYSTDLKRRTIDRLSHERFNFVEGDLLTLDLVELLASANTVFHLAAQPGVRNSWGADFESYASANVVATQRLLDAAHRAGTSRLIYASSSSVYGERVPFPVIEDSRLRPFSPYGITKLGGEQLCVAYSDNFGLHTVSLRLFTVFGPRQRPDMAFSRFISGGLSGDPIRVNGNGEQVRDFTYVDDVVAAMIGARDAAVRPGTVLNIAGGNAASVNEVLQTIASLVGELRIEYGPAQPGDVQRTGASGDRARTLLGWNPRVSLGEGLARQVKWVLENSMGAP